MGMTNETTPLAWQVPNIRAMVAAVRDHGLCVDRSITGAGKTYMALFAAKHLGMQVAIVCPCSVLGYWREIAAEIGVPVQRITNYEALLASTKVSEYYVDKPPIGEETARERRTRVRSARLWNSKVHDPKDKKLRRRTVNLSEAHKLDPQLLGGWGHVNREWEWLIEPNTLLIIDEVHRCGGLTSKYSRFLKGIRDCKIPAILLSATLADSPLKMRGLGYCANLFRSYSSQKFKAWCLLNGCDYQDYNKLVFTGDKSDMERIKGTFFSQLTGVLRTDAPDFPVSNILLHSVEVEGVEELSHAYTDALEELKEDATTGGVMALRARQLSEWKKRLWMLQAAKDMLEDGTSPVVFTAFRATGEFLSDQLKCDFISGDNKKDERAETIRKFQANETLCLVVMVDAGGESISLHDLHGRPRATLVSPNYNGITLVQLLGRVPRAKSQQSVVNQHLIFAKGCPYEGRMRRSLKTKTSNITALTDNDTCVFPQAFSPDGVDKACEEAEVCDDPAIPMSETKFDKSKEKPVLKSAHSKRSPSNLKNLDACPHYEQDPKEELKDMHENTVHGLKVHLVAECYFDPEKENNLEGQDVELFEGIEQEHVDRAQYAIDYAEKELKRFEPYDLATEPRLHTPHPNTWGRCDLVALSGKTGILFDWKDGIGWQGEAADNLQAWAYVLACFHMYPELETIEFHFVYTRLEKETVAVFSRSEDYNPLMERVTKINRECDRVEMNGAKLHKKGDVCTFCNKKVRGCPQWDSLVPSAVVGNSLTAQNDLPKEWSLEYLSSRPDEAGRALNAMHFFEEYTKELKTLALAMAVDDDLEILGHDVIDSKGRVSCSDPDGAFLIAESQGLPLPEFMATVRTMSVGKLIDSLARHSHKTQGITLAKSKAHFRKNMLDQGIVSEGMPYSYLKRSTK